MTDRILSLQVHEDLQLIERWHRAGLLPSDNGLSLIRAAIRPNSRVLSLHTAGLDLVQAVFIDRPENFTNPARTIHGVLAAALGKEKINVATFREYAEQCKYIEAKLFLNTNFSYMRGIVSHRYISPKLMPLGVVPETIELYYKTRWEKKLEFLQASPIRNEVRLKLIGFSQNDTKKVCKLLNYELTGTVFAL